MPYSIDPKYFRLSLAVRGLAINKSGMMLTRGANNKTLMAIVSEYTGTIYKRNHVDLAIEDGNAFLQKMRNQELGG